MRNSLRAVALTMLLAAVATPALAQQRGASRLGTRTAQEGDALAAARMVGTCVAQSHAAVAQQWLDTLPGSRGEDAVAGRLNNVFEDCMISDQMVMDNRTLSFRYSAMRRPVAVAMARRALRRNPHPAAPPAETPAWYAAAVAQPGATYDPAQLSLAEFGRCAAVAKWNEAIALIAADPDTPQERTAIAAIAPSLGPCLPQGARISIRRDQLRDILAEPVYHLLVATRAT